MAKLVLAAGVPHPPRLVRDIAESPGKTKGEALMKQVRQYVEKAEPDVIIEVDSDHFVNFFYNNLPSFLLNHLYRYELFGVNRDNYLSRIREGLAYDPRFEQDKMPIQYFVKG